MVNSARAAVDYLFHCIPKEELDRIRLQGRSEVDGAFLHDQVHYLF